MNRKRTRDGKEGDAQKQNPLHGASPPQQSEDDAIRNATEASIRDERPQAVSSSYLPPRVHSTHLRDNPMFPSAHPQPHNPFTYHTSLFNQHMQLQASANSDGFPIRKPSLAESLPVAASFHPAELFGPSTPPVSQRRTEDANGMVQQMLNAAAGPLSPSESLLRASMNPLNLQHHSNPHLSQSMSRLGGDPRAWSAASFDGSLSGGPLMQRFFAGDQSGFGANESNASHVEDPSSSRITASIGRGEPSWQGGETEDGLSRDPPLPITSNPGVLLAATTDSLAAARPPVDYDGPGGDKVKIFPSILHRLLLDLENVEGGRDIACFTMPHGKSFIVKDLKRFESEIMPNYFPRMNRFASFQRQLNLYNFARISGNGPDRGAYCHQLFVRSHPELAKTMRRTKIKGLFTVPEEKRRKRAKESLPDPSTTTSADGKRGK